MRGAPWFSVVVGCVVAVSGSAWADLVADDWADQYAELTELLAQRPADGGWGPVSGEALREQTLRPEALLLGTDRDPLDVLIRRARALRSDLQRMPGAPDLSAEAVELERLGERAAATPVSDGPAREELFADLCALRRRIAFRNPLLDFGDLVFLTHDRAGYEHMVDQYFGFHAARGGDVRVLRNAFGETPTLVRPLTMRGLEGGSFLSLDLSFDATEVLFAWTAADRVVEKWTDYVPYEVLWTPRSCYHVFRASVDGQRLEQLTDGAWNDFDPVYLPDGGIAFVSDRRGGYLRCGLRPDPTYTLHRMEADGSGIRALSVHETHEWHPSVTQDGSLIYTRWDYVDRDSDIAHHPWLTTIHGGDPRSYHGNYPSVRESRPWMEMSIRAIPGSHRYVAVAAPHHGQAYGSLVLVDHRVPDDRAMSQVKRLTPYTLFPEAEEGGRHARFAFEDYGSPWPLSETYHLCVYDRRHANYGVYLVDAFGNRELVFRDPSVPCLDPIPLAPRAKPPVRPLPAPSGAREGMATVAVLNVYDSDFAWPEDARVEALRVVQLFPKETPPAAEPNIGIGDQSVARGVLGTVPVEADGSAHFEMPAGAPVYFQALDGRGMAIQTMRSDTYAQPGETLTCQGCHEPKHEAPPVGQGPPLALRRHASTLQPEVDGAYPVSYARLVQDVLDRNCVACHAAEGALDLSGAASESYGWTRSYVSLAPFAWAKHGGNGSGLRKNGTSYSIAGQVGARASRLLPLLEGEHCGARLSAEDLHRITLWLDCNSVFYGAYHDLEKQAEGALVTPRLR